MILERVNDEGRTLGLKAQTVANQDTQHCADSVLDEPEESTFWNVESHTGEVG